MVSYKRTVHISDCVKKPLQGFQKNLTDQPRPT